MWQWPFEEISQAFLQQQMYINSGNLKSQGQVITDWVTALFSSDHFINFWQQIMIYYAQDKYKLNSPVSLQYGE